MDPRPVGVFDSGLGGISVLGAAVKELPNENFLYFGDTKNIPYGDKPPEQVYRLVENVVDTLLAEDCKAIVIACNTATSVAAAALREKYTFPVIGIEPALKPASLLPGSGKIAVLATQVTLALPKFRALMEQYGQDALPVSCSGLMECVEKGMTEGPELDALLDRLLAPCREVPIRAAVLGCTHYPFLKKSLSAWFGPEVPLLDGSAGTARQLRRRLAEEGLLSDGPGGKVRFMSSAPGAEKLMEQMLQRAMTL